MKISRAPTGWGVTREGAWASACVRVQTATTRANHHIFMPPPHLSPAHSHYCAHSVYTAVRSLHVLTIGTIGLADASVRCRLAVLHQELVWLDRLRESRVTSSPSRQNYFCLPGVCTPRSRWTGGVFTIEPYDCPAVSQESGTHLLHVICSKCNWLCWKGLINSERIHLWRSGHILSSMASELNVSLQIGSLLIIITYSDLNL